MGSQAYTTPGQYTFTVPTGVTVITVRCYGGGGAGGSSDRNGGRGGGGGGGNFAESTIAVSPNTTYNIIVGSGGRGLTTNRASEFNAAKPIVRASGGNDGQNVRSGTTAYGAGAASNTGGCIGTIIRAGGSGGNGVDNGSGAGGGCAGPTGVGGNASTNTAGAGNSPGGNGANGVSPTSAGTGGSGYGGGGSGGATPDIHLGSARLGGTGGNGAVIITWADAPPANVCICLYSNCSTISAGCYLYSNVSLTEPVNAGYYSDSVYCYTVTSGGYVSSVSNCSGGGSQDYYHYYVDSYACPSCGTTTGPSNGLVASINALTTGYYYYDSTSGNVYYLTSYYGYGQYGGQVINPSSGMSSCSVACSI